MGLLRALGYANAREVAGGLEAWRERGGELERGASTREAGGARRRRPRGWIARGIDALERATPAQLAGLGFGLVLLSAAAFMAAHGLGLGALTVGGAEVSTEDLWTALYASLATVSTLGYGDVVPLGAARFVSVFEALAGLLLFGALISKFLSRRQERLIEEIHRLAYEDRLGRLQTNLHLVLRELGSLEQACREAEGSPDSLRRRLESTSLLFASEVRSVHDVLYRPPEEPTEDVLESVLVALAGALDLLAAVLACTSTRKFRTALLEEHLERIAARAMDICSECIPGRLAQRLAPWLDQVQDAARGLSRPHA